MLPPTNTPEVYLTVRPLQEQPPTPLERRSGLLTVFGAHPENIQYLDGIIRNASPLWVIHQRLSALECLATLLTAHLPQAVTRLRLARDERGRPYAHLDDLTIGPIDFNLSHTKHYAGCVLMTAPGQVGLDLEEIISEEKAAALATRYFSDAEKERISVGACRSAATTWVWTAKEALAKQSGQGQPLTFDSSLCPPSLILYQGRVHGDASYTPLMLTVCAPASCPRPTSDTASLPIDWLS